MNEFNNISDEQLACFIEDNLCEAESDCILDAIACDADMDVLSISYQASKLVGSDNVVTQNDIIDLPHWRNGSNPAFMHMSLMSHQLRESAFLGDDYMALDACCDFSEAPDDLGVCACEAEQDDLISFDEFEDNDGSKE